MSELLFLYQSLYDHMGVGTYSRGACKQFEILSWGLFEGGFMEEALWRRLILGFTNLVEFTEESKQ